MLKLFKNLKKEEWCMIAVSLIFIVLQVWLDLTMPEYMADITGLVQTPGSEMGDILAAGGKMLIVLGLQMLVKAPIMAVWAICRCLFWTRQLLPWKQEQSSRSSGQWICLWRTERPLSLPIGFPRSRMRI